MTNEVTLVGCVSSEFTYDHNVLGENFYKVTVSVKRESGVNDEIPIVVSEKLIDLSHSYLYEYVGINGQFRSHNSHGGGVRKLLLFVFAKSFDVVDAEDVNDVYLEGTINDKPTYRRTPLGREICDVKLKVSRSYGKSDYLPCIAWGSTAKYISSLPVGAVIRVAGRIQSREYLKYEETHTAYELSVSLIESV